MNISFHRDLGLCLLGGRLAGSLVGKSWLIKWCGSLICSKGREEVDSDGFGETRHNFTI